MARELIVLPRFKRDYRTARKYSEFDAETLEYVFDVMISGGKLPDSLREHRLDKRRGNWSVSPSVILEGICSSSTSSPRVSDSPSHRHPQSDICPEKGNDASRGATRSKAAQIGV